jgi:hypothetical protein
VTGLPRFFFSEHWIAYCMGKRTIPKAHEAPQQGESK